MPDVLWMGLTGLATGALAEPILSGNDPGGLILTMLRIRRAKELHFLPPRPVRR